MSSDVKLLLQAESIIQRDAILAALKENGIEAFSAPRDISRKIADSTIDLAYEGYSALFDGFAIQVAEQDFNRAKQIADQLLKKAEAVEKATPQAGSMRRFYFCCLFCVSIPLLFHGLALYHLINAVRSGEKFHPVFGTMSLIVFAATGFVVGWVLMSANILEILRSLAQML